MNSVPTTENTKAKLGRFIRKTEKFQTDKEGLKLIA